MESHPTGSFRLDRPSGRRRSSAYRRGDPLEYLERWRNANRLLGDNSVLRGVSETDEGVQVVISHPFIEGPYPEKREIIGELRNRGFVMVPGFFIGSESDSSFYHEAERIGIFDATCDNFILSQGVPIPVDVVIVAMGDALRRQLLNLICLTR